MINQRKIGKQKPLPKVKSDEIPWSLPKNWLWCRLGEVTAYGLTEKAEYPDVEKNTWVLELEDIEKGTSRLIQRVTAKDRKFKSTKKKFFKGNILYGKLRPYLDKVIIADADGVCTTEIIPIYSFYGIDPEYLRWYLKSPFFREYANSSTHGMNLPRLGTEKARSALFALPPLREQKSCVAIINELMALFEKLEAQQQKRESLCKLTRTAILNALANSQTPEELQPAWKRLRENIHLLFDTPESVGEIRKSILMLAVTGKLTEKTTLSAKDCLINIKKDCILYPVII